MTMASDFARLLKQDFSDMEAAAEAWRKLSTTMQELAERHRSKVTGPLHAQWEGEDADTALYYLEDVETRIGLVRTEAMAVHEVVDTTRLRMEQAQTDLRNAVRRAEENGYEVDDDGTVSDPQTASLPRNDPDAQEIARQRGGPMGEYRRWIDDALTDARKASDDGKKALSGLNGDIMERFNFDAAAESASDVDAAMKALGIQDPQVPRDDPKAAAEWWKALDPEERDLYTTLYPDLIGSTDGLPTTVRNDANRLALEQELNALENREGRSFGDTTNEDLNTRQQNLMILRDMLDEGDGAPAGKERYLLAFDSDGDGKAVVAMGNPDTAAHTGVLVPGTNTTMESMPGQLNRISALQDSAKEHSDGEDVAMISWLGYDAPEAAATDFNSVTTEGRAQDAAPDLRQFLDGTRASHQGAPSHLTVIGHSYGSTTVGAAAAGGDGLGADDIVAVGSPGMTVNEAGDLQIDPDRVWIGAAGDDEIIDMFSDFNLGDNPAEEPFGGNNFEVDTSGHSGYWDPNSRSLDNQGKIISGRPPTEVPKEENDVPLLPW
ncbi:alpha/beta hydrolase [Streptomyces sp. HB2AG]|uniref:alpha/beta hydrolase n=1 Tax=Streptomyces sp. HB2AG TaxID=2983400 RepID=UPI0022AAA140|nr:alpha/beta hydrolase [Streptomyces sp. HB2AG]MCZ2524879.1 alpha/beta hydrolase [Streptomyces sp. HB2AG]